MTRTIATWAIAATLVVLAGCMQTQRPEATGKGNIRGINAITTAPNIGFLIEERTQANLAYKETVATHFDDLSYNVNFDAVLAGDSKATRIASDFVDVTANTEYIFVLTGSLASPTIMRLEHPEHQWQGGETSFEARAAHFAPGVGDVDVYLAAPGTVPVLGNAIGTLAYGEILPGYETAAGDYELILTAKDDPTNVLYRSRAVTQLGGVSVLYGIFDPDPSITGNISVRIMGQSGQGAELADADAPPTIRLFHAAFGVGNVDMYANDDFSAPVIGDAAFGVVTPDVDFIANMIPVAFTPVGNPGTLLLEGDVTALAGTHNTVVLLGTPAEPAVVVYPDNRRPIETAARVRFIQVSTNIGTVDVYVNPAGTDINDVSPRFFGAPTRATTGYVNFNADSYEIAVTLPGEKNIIAGPLPLDLALGDVVNLLLVDTADPNVLDLIVYSD